MKKKKKAPAAQHLIDSLLDEAAPPPTKLAPVAPSGKDSQSIDEAPFLNAPTSTLTPVKDWQPESVVTASKSKSDGAFLGAKKEINDDGQSPTIMLTAEDDATSHLKIDGNTSSLIPDPLAKAERAEKSRLELVLPPKDNPPPTRAKPEPLVDKTALVEKPLPFEAPSSENTVRLDEKAKKKPVDPYAATEIRPGAALKRPASTPPGLGGGVSMFSSAEAALKQSESLRIAQEKITELEYELERLRRENEQLASAGETLRRRADELLAKTEAVELQARESQRIHDEERKVLRSQLTQKDRESAELKQRVDEMEMRLESNFKKIRVRERELEHRLEIVKMESATLVSTKDKMLLELKRQIDQLTHENDYGKQKTQELFNQYKDKQETIRRVVRALRIALTILEGDEDNGMPLKKAE